MNLALTRKLAILQATAANLRETSRSFTEQSDMLAHRQFQMELAEYLGTHRAVGDIPHEPEAFMCGELDRLEEVVRRVGKFASEQLELGKAILAAKPQSLTKTQVAECQVAGYPRRQAAVAHKDAGRRMSSSGGCGVRLAGRAAARAGIRVSE